jgi:phosphatidylethanolamine/phosphatidyl-N-methylethanolamine N-methyltransferase
MHREYRTVTENTPQKDRTFRERVVSDFRFLKSWAKQPKSVGSITPTSKIAARLMASHIPTDSDLPVLELGPGTGPITRAILDFGINPSKLVSIEYNHDFCTLLRKSYPGVNFIEGDAFDLETTLAEFKDQKFRALLSGLPLLNFPTEKRSDYVTEGLKWLPKGAPFIQLCYGPKPPVKALPGVYSVEPTKWVLSNVPPARFWIYRQTA